MAALQQCFLVNPVTAHTYTVILLHGRGSTGEEFAEELFECIMENSAAQLDQLNLKQLFPTCKWIFPNAKLRYSAVFQEEMTEWFDIYSLTNPHERQELQKEGLTEAAQLLEELIHEELDKVPPRNLILGGISQGYATAALTLIGLDIRMAGFFGLSDWMPFREQIKVEALSTSKEGLSSAHAVTAAARKILGLTDKAGTEKTQEGAGWSSTPIFLGHEEHDPVVACKLGKAACEVFRACEGKPEWHVYNSGDHWIQEPDEISDLIHFLAKCMYEGKPVPSDIVASSEHK